MANGRETSSMRTRTGCLTCRLRHVKCDETKPVCDRCRRGERECVLADPAVNFRNMFVGRYDYNGRNSTRSNSAASREKHTTLRHVTFIKNSELASSHPKCLDRRLRSRPTTTNSPADEIHLLQTPTSSGEAQMLSSLHDELPTESNTGSASHFDTFEPCLSVSRPLLPDQALPGIASDGSSIVTENSTTAKDSISPLFSSQVWLSGGSGMLRSHRQAELLRFYKEFWAPGLDSQDDGRHFTIQVPLLALNMPILLNAIFAVASLHQSRLSGSSPSIAEEYHGKCVKLLLNMFEHDHAPMDDILLATTVILRVYEQMNGSVGDNECHLLGASALASTHPSTSGSLWKAAFWVYLRQDIYMAVVDQRPVRIDLSRCWVWRESQPRNDAEWSQLIMLITAEITEFCFTQTTTRDIEKWQVLREQVDEWHRCRPKTFEPYHFAERHVDVDRYFPEIWLSEQWHVMANIYHVIAQALLLIYDPNPAFGIEARRHQRIVQARMVEYARRICGICLSNSTPETWRTSCYAIHLCCPYITNQREQELIIQILEETESKGAWPTVPIIQALKEEWEPVFQMQDTERDLIYV